MQDWKSQESVHDSCYEQKDQHINIHTYSYTRHVIHTQYLLHTYHDRSDDTKSTALHLREVKPHDLLHALHVALQSGMWRVSSYLVPPEQNFTPPRLHRQSAATPPVGGDTTSRRRHTPHAAGSSQN